MPARPDDIYGNFGSVPTVPPPMEGGGGPNNARATPESFGVNVADTVKQTGDEGVELAKHYEQLQAETHANNLFLNQFVPQASQLRADFDNAPIENKEAAAKIYQQKMSALGANLQKNIGPLTQERISGLITRHQYQEMDAVNREVTQANKQNIYNAGAGLTDYNVGQAVKAYNDPETSSSFEQSARQATILHATQDNPNATEADVQHAIDQTQSKIAMGKLAQATGVKPNVAVANQTLADNATVLNGPQKLVIEPTVMTQNREYNAKQGFYALIGGRPIPEPFGKPPSVVRASVANAAYAAGESQQDILTALNIESADGKNLGTRGNIGQIDKAWFKAHPEYDPNTLEGQSAAMAARWKEARADAAYATGGNPDGLQTYMAYQQGKGGYKALYDADKAGSTQSAMKVLQPIYAQFGPNYVHKGVAYTGEPGYWRAYFAIKDNGGTVQMTSSDFLKYWNKRWDQYSQVSRIANIAAGDVGMKSVGPATTAVGTAGPMSVPTQSTVLPGETNNDPELGNKITNAHTATVPAVVPGYSAHDNLLAYEDRVPALVQHAMSLPYSEERNGILASIEKHRQELKMANEASLTNLRDGVAKMINQPNFTNTDMMPADVRARIMSEDPMYWHVVEAAVAHNNHVDENAPPSKAFMQMLAKATTGQLTDAEMQAQIKSEDNPSGGITYREYNELQKQRDAAFRDPNKATIMGQGLLSLRHELGVDTDEEMRDNNEINNAWMDAQPSMIEKMREGLENKIPMSEMIDPKNKNFVGGPKLQKLLNDQMQKLVAQMRGKLDNQTTPVADYISNNMMDNTSKPNISYTHRGADWVRDQWNFPPSWPPQKVDEAVMQLINLRNQMDEAKTQEDKDKILKAQIQYQIATGITLKE